MMLLTAAFLLVRTAAAATVTLTSTSDAELRQHAPNTVVYGGNGGLIKLYERTTVTLAPIKTQALLYFNIDSVPAAKDITKATLRLKCTNIGKGPTIIGRKMIASWSESTAKWNSFKGKTSKKTSYGGGISTLGGQADKCISFILDGPMRSDDPNWYIDIDVTDDVALWHSGAYENRGWMMESENSQKDTDFVFGTKNHGDDDFRPKLIIKYD